MKQQAAIDAAERKAKRDHTIMFVVYDPSDHEATTPNDAYFPATPEEESTYFRGAEVVCITAHRSEEGTWEVYARKVDAHRTRGEGPTITYNGRGK